MSANNWVFTWNLPSPPLDATAAWDVALPDLAHPNIRYYIYSEEVGANGNYHIQGYLQLYESQRLSWLIKLLPGAHFEKQRASNNEDARAYCAKVGDPTFVSGPYESGTFVSKGARSDLTIIKDKLKAGTPMLSIAEDHFGDWVRYHRAFTQYASMLKNTRNSFSGCTVLYGPSGTGKTHLARSLYPDAYWLTRPNNQAFYFEAYAGEETIIIDEFYGWLPYDFLLRLCDKYPLQLPFRGGVFQCLAKTVVITTNRRPSMWYKAGLGAMERRITKWIHFTDYATYYETSVYLDFQSHVLDHEFVQ